MVIKEKRSNLEMLFSQYRLYKRLEQMGSVIETKITQNYEPRYHKNTNSISNPVEEAVLRNMEIAEERKTIIVAVETAVSMLDEQERVIVEMRYMRKDYIYDYHVYDFLGIGNPTYRIRRDAALKKLFILLEAVIMDKSYGVP